MILLGKVTEQIYFYLPLSCENCFCKSSLFHCDFSWPCSGISCVFSLSPDSLSFSFLHVCAISFPCPFSLILSSLTSSASWTISSCLAPSVPPSSIPFGLWKATQQNPRHANKHRKERKWSGKMHMILNRKTMKTNVHKDHFFSASNKALS